MDLGALTTAHLADGCLRAGLPLRCASLQIIAQAEAIHDTERRQAAQISNGTSLRRQVRFGAYLARREHEPSLTFREHLRDIGGAIEV